LIRRKAIAEMFELRVEQLLVFQMVANLIQEQMKVEQTEVRKVQAL
jgi:hypothetical protein